MKIAIPTSDRITVFKRTGRAKEFAICEIVDGSYHFLEFRENPHQHHDHEEGEHDHNHDHKDVLNVLKDCDALLVWTAGPHFRADFDEANIPMFKTNLEDLKEAISFFSFDMLSHERI